MQFTLAVNVFLFTDIVQNSTGQGNMDIDMNDDEMRLPEASESIHNSELDDDAPLLVEPGAEAEARGPGHHLRRPSRKAQYMMPEGPGALLDPEGDFSDNEPESFAQVSSNDPEEAPVAPRR